MEIEITNMCMVLDPATQRVVVQNRVKYWTGLAFPGGHLERGESLVESAIREVREETGLVVSNLRPCGIIHWNRTDADEHYFVHLYRTETFHGQLLPATEEGSVAWMPLEELISKPKEALCPHFRDYLRLFLDDSLFEGHIPWAQGEDTREIVYFGSSGAARSSL